MTDLFKKEDVIALLQGKTLLILGGSIQRGIYKDIIWLMNSDTLINRGVSETAALLLFGYHHLVGKHFHCRFWGTKQKLVSLTSRVTESPSKTQRNRKN